MEEYKYQLHRLVQLPLSHIEFSKNVIDITTRGDDLTQTQKDLDILFTKEMAQMKLSLEELKASEEIQKALKALEFVNYLQTKSKIAQAVIKEKEIFFS